MTDFNGKGVVLTGAASGIGRLMAIGIASAGGRVALWDIDESGLENVRAEIVAAGGHAVPVRCNLSDRGSVKQAAAQTLQALGSVDVLINNAGVVSGKDLLEISDEQIELTFNVNALALFWTTRAFLPAMLERDCGHIVTIASAGGIAGTAKLVDYCSSKFAAVGFDDSLRAELKSRKSKVMTTVICPYYIDTGMFAGVSTRFPAILPILDPDKSVRRILAAVSKNRRRLIMPWFVYTTYLMRLAPVALSDWALDFFGVTHSMDRFIGRKS
ncbi:MAG: SDR family oxidoreductase [Gammaproteobacteria bacterium]|nr:SDR family oxidoreductase [Gammaproteobacteria bacterium]MDH3768411.1 SDR family oxidoreductase [Gammaproteobacteria bacterium]